MARGFSLLEEALLVFVEKEMATHSSIFAWKIPWTEEPARLPWGCKESDMTQQLHFLLLVFEAQDPSLEWYMRVAAAIQNATQGYCVIYNEKERATRQRSLGRFLKRVDRIESGKEPEPGPSVSGVSEIAVCPLHLVLWMILQLCHRPPLLPPPLACSVSASPCMPAVVLYLCTL